MSASESADVASEMLLSGPRGRRLLLEYVLALANKENPDRSAGTLGYTVFHVSRQLAGDDSNESASIGWKAPEPVDVSLGDLIELFESITLPEPTVNSIRRALLESAGYARYWQRPEGEDILAAMPEMRQGLKRVAESLTESGLTDWWLTSTQIRTQQVVHWENRGAPTPPEKRRDVLFADRSRLLREELSAQASRAAAKEVVWSGEWWSRPPQSIPSSTRTLDDGSPAGLWFVEDDLGWEEAEAVDLVAPDDARVFEISTVDDWVELCKRFPLVVSAMKRDDWRLATSCDAEWVVPDWAGVSEEYDAVHLQVGAYLSGAGVSIPINDDDQSASVIAGWNPDETFWFSSDVVCATESTVWEFVESSHEMTWQRKP